MAKETKYSIRNLQKDFPTEEAYLDFVFTTLHSKECSCGGSYKPIKGRKQYQCSKCRFQISPTAGTVFHKSDTPLSLWFHAIFIFSNAKSGISAKELERQLGVTYKTAWRMLYLIRKALPQDKKKLWGDVEIDTGFFGGKGYGGKYNENQKKVMANKSIVTVAVQRGGRIRAEIVPDLTTETMKAFIERNIENWGTDLMTDSSPIYKHSDTAYRRTSVNHSRNEYVRGKTHVNTIEMFFAHLKRSMKGTYKAISKQHLQSYLDAFVFLYNNRRNDRTRFEVLVGNVLNA